MDITALFIAICCFVIAWALWAWLAPLVQPPPLNIVVKIVALIVGLIGVWYLIVFLASLIDSVGNGHHNAHAVVTVARSSWGYLA